MAKKSGAAKGKKAARKPREKADEAPANGAAAAPVTDSPATGASAPVVEAPAEESPSPQAGAVGSSDDPGAILPKGSVVGKERDAWRGRNPDGTLRSTADIPTPPGATRSSPDPQGRRGLEGATADEPVAGQGGPAPSAPKFTHIGVLGHVGWLLSRSPAHRHLFVADLEWLAMPPVALNQFRLWRRDNMPIGYASWAFLGEPQAARLSAGIRRLSPADWRSGEELWIVDLITPFGGREEAIKELKEQVFPDRKIKTLEPAPDGKRLAVVEW